MSASAYMIFNGNPGSSYSFPLSKVEQSYLFRSSYESLIILDIRLHYMDGSNWTIYFLRGFIYGSYNINYGHTKTDLIIFSE